MQPNYQQGRLFKRTPNASDEWLTPPHILKALGEFDLDPCSPIERPWPTAKKHYTVVDDGLTQPWSGRVWLNPPYGLEARQWLAKLAKHGNGIALVFARTETEMFFESVWGSASGILFIRGRLTFYLVTGSESTYNGGAPSCLIAYGRANGIRLWDSGIEGKFLFLP